MFDGYTQKPITKDHAHKFRAQSTRIGRPDVQMTATTRFATKKDVFLSKTRNKQNIIDLFPEILLKEWFRTIHASDDADTLKAHTDLAYSKEEQVKVIRENTDILLLLWHFIYKDVRQVMF